MNTPASLNNKDSIASSAKLALRPILLSILAIIVSGCGYGYKNVSRAPNLDHLTRNAAVVVDVQEKGDADATERSLLANSIVEKLRASGRFGRVDVRQGEIPDGVDLVVDCHISDIKRVNRAVRILFGAFPGRAWVEIKVILRNQKEGTIDGEAVIEGASSGGTIFAGITDHAIDNAAQTISDFVLEIEH